MEIARAAATLFVRQGLRATRAEDIAHAAGIAPRTFYRYFASKEEAVAPLYATGAQLWTEAVREAPAHLTLPEALRYAVDRTLAPGVGVSASAWEWARTLIRMAHTSPALRKVWAEVCQASETELAEALAARLTPARQVPPAADDEPGRNEATPAGSEPGRDEAGPADNVAAAEAAEAADPHLRFAAAVAGAAVRVAVESWALTDSPPTGPAGPAALAVRNLAALGDFAWRETE
ncbi:TetR/AcrR family transcriptional regulator [Streptomyces sp. NPDC085596]|uniref:TetR/AcrR family transcriptional regulator n=1 Tax=Streptomyces sp. NPDC085596 TaxID=3365731 RepID=UPI0037D33968